MGIVSFIVILTIIIASIVITEVRTSQLSNQEATAHDIQTGASNLNYISSNYLLYQDNSSISLWQTQFARLSEELAKLNSTDLHRQTLVNNVKNDLQNLNAVFNSVVSILEKEPGNVSVGVLPQFQIQWSRIAVQVQALSFDAQQLSQNLRDQVDQANSTNIILIITLLGLFGIYFLTVYIITYRKTYKSIVELQKGIGVIGSGNLDYSLKANKDEIGEISQSVNQMTANLKTVTASKSELERALTERKNAEEALKRSNAELQQFASRGQPRPAGAAPDRHHAAELVGETIRR